MFSLYEKKQKVHVSGDLGPLGLKDEVMTLSVTADEGEESVARRLHDLTCDLAGT